MKQTKNKLIETYVKALVEKMIVIKEEEEEDGSKESQLVATPPRFVRPERRAQVRKTFNMDEFKKEQGLEAKQRYLQLSLKQVGAGTSRAVFLLPDGKSVIKLSLNPAGNAQNKAEATICQVDKSLNVFTKVEETGENYDWIISEFASKMSDSEFQQATKIPWVTFGSAIRAAFPEELQSGSVPSERNKQDLQGLAGNSWFMRLVNVIKGCHYMAGDLTKLSSWGTINGRPVILDSGFTKAVNQGHYNGTGTPKQ
jgi:hypothetical protein